MTIQEFTLNKLEEHLKLFNEEHHEYADTKKQIEIIRSDLHPDRGIEVNDKGWVKSRDIKSTWYSSFKGVTYHFIRYWKNDYTAKRVVSK